MSVNETILETIASLLPSSSSVIGIVGPSGAGKTTLADKLLAHLSLGNACLINVDNYRPYSKEEMIKRGILSRCMPESYDAKKLRTDIAALKDGISIQVNVQDRISESDSGRVAVIEPRNHIIVEGNVDMHGFVDIQIFVWAPDEILLERRQNRDSGTQHAQQATYKNDIRKSLEYYREFLEPFKEKSHILFNSHTLETLTLTR